MAFASHYHPLNTWADLGLGFSDPVSPATFPKAILRYRNQEAADTVGLKELADEEWIKHFARFEPLPGSLPTPQAIRYHGHQFTHYNPELGDGRGFLFAQLKEVQSKRILDLGTKGSGQTPYSRRGDGRLTLKGAVREALATSYLQHLGVNTSKTLSVIETGEALARNDEPSPTRSAVMVRLSHSHVRFGAFQRLAHCKEKQSMQQLVNYSLKHLYPETKEQDFFMAICRQVAKTTAQWMIHGFVHGVLNTDNMNITGESFDYGPYRFLPHYDPKFTAAYFDHNGLYAYGQQPTMVLWNLERLAEALKLCIEDQDYYERGFKVYRSEFEQQTLSLFCEKIGVQFDGTKIVDIKNLFYLCLQFLQESKAPYTEFFHHLYCWHQDLNKPLNDFNPALYTTDLIEEIEKLLGRLPRNPNAPVKASDQVETLLIDEIESLWRHIEVDDNWEPFKRKIERLKLNQA